MKSVITHRIDAAIAENIREWYHEDGVNNVSE
jgi:hypothetical protein